MTTAVQSKGYAERLALGLTSLERKAVAAIEEQIEQYALTDATHARSTSRVKSRADRAADNARVKALCEAVHLFSEDRTPFEAEQRLHAQAAAARP